MNIKFSALGLPFDAEVTYIPGTSSKTFGPPEECHEGEAPEIDFRTLMCNGDDAMFLFDAYTHIVDALYMAALDAAHDTQQKENAQ